MGNIYKPENHQKLAGETFNLYSAKKIGGYSGLGLSDTVTLPLAYMVK